MFWCCCGVRGGMRLWCLILMGLVCGLRFVSVFCLGRLRSLLVFEVVLFRVVLYMVCEWFWCFCGYDFWLMFVFLCIDFLF